MLSPLLSFVGYPLLLGQESRNVSKDSTSAPLSKSEEKLPTWYFDLDLHVAPETDEYLFIGSPVGLGLKLELRLSRFVSLVAGDGPGTFVPFIPEVSSYQGSIRIYPLKSKKVFVGVGLFTQSNSSSTTSTSSVPYNGQVFSLGWRQNRGIGFEAGYRFGIGPRGFHYLPEGTTTAYYLREGYLTVTLTFFSH